MVLVAGRDGQCLMRFSNTASRLFLLDLAWQHTVIERIRPSGEVPFTAMTIQRTPDSYTPLEKLQSDQVLQLENISFPLLLLPPHILVARNVSLWKGGIESVRGLQNPTPHKEERKRQTSDFDLAGMHST